MIPAKVRRVVLEELAALPHRKVVMLEERDSNGYLVARHQRGLRDNACFREIVGHSTEDLAGLRKRLRSLGIKGSIGELDGMVYEIEAAAWEAGRSSDPYAASETDPSVTVAAFVPRPKQEGALTEKERARRKRARKKMLGLCTQCPMHPGTPAMPGRTVCAKHSAGAYDRVKAGRAAKKGEPVLPDWMARIPGDT